MEQNEKTETRHRFIAQLLADRGRRAGVVVAAESRATTARNLTDGNSRSDWETNSPRARAVLTNDSALGRLDKLNDLANLVRLFEFLPDGFQRLRRIIFRAVDQPERFFN